jgi:hypothetical protein
MADPVSLRQAGNAVGVGKITANLTKNQKANLS